MRPALTGEMPAVHESVAWTWRVAPSLMDHVHGGVSAAYPPWGTTPPVADTAADFAVQFVDAVLKIEPPRHTHVCVTAGLSDRLLALSVALALGPDDTTAGITVGQPPPPGMRPSPVYEGCYPLQLTHVQAAQPDTGLPGSGVVWSDVASAHCPQRISLNPAVPPVQPKDLNQ
ncbi:hypothetical protein ACFC18_50895 [Streptomyces sp. NPDC056121]|uniref:hypothetical protein n=1 Tax=unclassified Streptomyces TaxID=2593676 RepID=UPI0035E22758